MLVEPVLKPSPVVPLEVELVVVNQNCSSHTITLEDALAEKSDRPRLWRPQLRASDPSGTAGPADPDLSFFYYSWNNPLSIGIAEHLFQTLFTLQNVDVLKRDLVAFVVLTGLGCVRSGVLSENQHFLLHGASHFCIT